MKKGWLILLLMFFCFCLTSVYGQQKQITRKDFYDAYFGSVNKSYKLPRRTVTVQKFFANEKLLETKTISDEIYPPDNWRRVIETKTGEKTLLTREKITLIEYIKVGKDTYYRKDNGEWKKGSGLGGGSGSGRNTESETFTVEKTTYNNQPVTIYQNASIYRDSNKQRAYIIERKWLSKDNILLKEELEDGLIEPKTIVRQETQAYEYDSNIKIEAPKIN